tara:strand:- start:179 stop:625 length:447 start_codon:yes stop_codon:yes gene_type:complete
MPDFTMQFDYPINESCQVGDIAYYMDVLQQEVGGFVTHNASTSAIEIGVIKKIEYIDTPITDTNNDGTLDTGDGTIDKVNITCDLASSTPPPSATSGSTLGDFIFFAKERVVNESSIVGYYGEAIFTNDSKEKAEMFSAACEIVGSSK